jgi:hypothetical protein
MTTIATPSASMSAIIASHRGKAGMDGQINHRRKKFWLSTATACVYNLRSLIPIYPRKGAA